jgi:hypothetical protein
MTDNIDGCLWDVALVAHSNLVRNGASRLTRITSSHAPIWEESSERAVAVGLDFKCSIASRHHLSFNSKS